MAKKTIYFDSFCGYIISAVTENGKLTEFNFEKSDSLCAVGNVYKGRVESVLPGMEATFVNCGLERNCFLSKDGFVPECDAYDGEDGFSQSFKEGDEVLVQVVKLPVGKKGAKVTACPSLVGKCLIYLPETPFVGVSSKIADEELRRNLAYSAKKLTSGSEGVVLRTVAPYAKRNQIKDEFSYLRNLYKEIKEKFKTARVGQLLYSDYSLPIRVLRDTLSTDIEKIYVGSEELKKAVEDIVNLYPAQTRRPVVLHDTGRDMLTELGIVAQMKEVASPKVELENGAYIIIEKTEALTVIDVNTGKFTGDYNLEQTVYHTNILAAREIARQVRLRNIGGIIVVDFIDMQNESHNSSLVQELERALKDDKAKCIVSPMSQFGLVEFTRKRMGASPVNLMTKPCRYCKEAGYTLSEEFTVIELRARILNEVKDGAKAIKADINSDVLTTLLNWEGFVDDLKKHCGDVKLYAVPHRTYHTEQINIRCGEFDIPSDAVKLN